MKNEYLIENNFFYFIAEDRHLAMQHIRRMDQVCRLPLATIVTIPRLTHQYYHPPYTVLNRCSVNSLCCPPHNVNVPRNVTKVDLYFIVSITLTIFYL